MNRWTRSLLGAGLAGCLAARAAATPVLVQDTMKSEKKEASLYDRLGKKKAIVAVVDQFVANVAADNRISTFFKETASNPQRLAAFKGKLVDQICQASGGPCRYTGKSMKEAHAGMGVSTADFNALVEDLVAALDKFKVGVKEKNELLGTLGGMKGDIVEKP